MSDRIQFDTGELSSRVTIKVKVRKLRWYQFRWGVSVGLVGLAAKIGGFGYEEVEQEPDLSPMLSHVVSKD